MHFLGSKFTQNSPRTPLGKLKCSPRLLADFRGREAGERERREKREEGKGKRGIGERKEGGKGRKGGRRTEREGRGSLRHWR